MDVGSVCLNCAEFLLQRCRTLQPEWQNAHSVPVSGALLQPLPGHGLWRFSQAAEFPAAFMNTLMFTMFLLVLCVLMALPLIVLNFLFTSQWGELVCSTLRPRWSPK